MRSFRQESDGGILIQVLQLTVAFSGREWISNQYGDGARSNPSTTNDNPDPTQQQPSWWTSPTMESAISTWFSIVATFQAQGLYRLLFSKQAADLLAMIRSMDPPSPLRPMVMRGGHQEVLWGAHPHAPVVYRVEFRPNPSSWITGHPIAIVVYYTGGNTPIQKRIQVQVTFRTKEWLSDLLDLPSTSDDEHVWTSLCTSDAGTAWRQLRTVYSMQSGEVVDRWMEGENA